MNQFEELYIVSRFEKVCLYLLWCDIGVDKRLWARGPVGSCSISSGGGCAGVGGSIGHLCLEYLWVGGFIGRG